MSSSLIGRMLGKYKIIDKLGQGGMATVYLGYQESVHRQVAIKVLPPHPGLDDQFVERFQLEARTIARLQHPHILPLYDYGVEDGIFYLAMAYVDGGTVEDMVANAPIPPIDIEKTLREVASAMDYAHRQGVVHRDIKPANILIDGEGHALLADFGIVKLSEGGSNLTGTGVVGTPAYMAPEQAQGLPIDARIDIYALGVVVYQLLTGTQPFMADTAMQVMIKVMNELPPDIHNVINGLPPKLSEVMRRVLAKKPEDRYQTAIAFAEAFSEAVHQDETSLRAVRDAVPLEKSEHVYPRQAQSTSVAQSTRPLTPLDSQPLIVQQGISPMVLLGGIAIFAIALVLVVLLLVNNSGDDSPNQVGVTQVATGNTPTAEVEVEATNTDAPPTDTPEPTETPTPAATEIPVFGNVSYSSSNGMIDSVSVRVEGLRSSGSGNVYIAWLVNEVDDTRLKLGNIPVDGFGNGAISFSDPEGRVLAAFFNAIEITVEASGFNGDVPAGEVMYSGRVPASVMMAIYSIFVSSPNGFNEGSLLDGAKTEAKSAATHAGLAAGAGNLGGVQSHSEHAINILRGEAEDYNGNDRGENPGKGVGVYAFLDWMTEELDSAVNSPDASLDLQANGEFIRICIQNTRDRADRIVELELENFAATDMESISESLKESSQKASELIDGFDANGDGNIDPYEEECGLGQIDIYGTLISSMNIYAE